MSNGARMLEMPLNTPWPTVVSSTAGAAKALQEAQAAQQDVSERRLQLTHTKYMHELINTGA
jgi:hypothetical protein